MLVSLYRTNTDQKLYIYMCLLVNNTGSFKYTIQHVMPLYAVKSIKNQQQKLTLNETSKSCVVNTENTNKHTPIDVHYVMKNTRFVNDIIQT